jgi:hypothetical protein
MGQTELHLYPPPNLGAFVHLRGCVFDVREVALQVEFERQILKPVFHLIGFRLWV